MKERVKVRESTHFISRELALRFREAGKVIDIVSVCFLRVGNLFKESGGVAICRLIFLLLLQQRLLHDLRADFGSDEFLFLLVLLRRFRTLLRLRMVGAIRIKRFRILNPLLPLRHS